MKFFISFSIALLLFNCNSSNQNIEPYTSNILKIEKVNTNIFQHISFAETENFGKVDCNGMVYINKDEAIVFDTPVNNEAAFELIHWLTKTHNKKLKAVVITHFHNDCLGGLEAFHKNNIPSYANELTVALAKKDSVIAPKNGFKNNIEIKVGNQSTFTGFFGEGHTKDNVVGYIPNEQALFGGCLIKCLGAGKGYLGDANVKEWSKTITNIKSKYAHLEIVIPGHGKNGNSKLLDYTINLFKP